MKVQEVIKKLDETILRFSDDPSGHPAATPATAEESFIRTFAPHNLETPFQELYSILQPCLRPRADATTASAILMGPRGSGKSLLVDRCLEACRQAHGSKFRKVTVNGIIVRGEDVPSVVYEIIRQLSDIALNEEAPVAAEKKTKKNDDEILVDANKASTEEIQPKKKRRRRKQEDEYLLRLRRSTFTSNLALLESTLKMAEVDRIPIVLILDELDAFILHSKESQQHRQLLLYHLLDRVATPGSNLTLVGLTSNFSALTQMEKRIRSRAEGTSKIVYLKPPTTYEQLERILADKLGDCEVLNGLKKYILVEGCDKDEQAQRVLYTLQREFRMGRNLRWFGRVLCTAISLYRFDCVLATDGEAPKFEGGYFVKALNMAGSLCLTDTAATSATKQSSICLVDGVAVDPRLQASLLDLSQSQIALLLAAKRILSREAHTEHAVVMNGDSIGVAPLTIQRMIREYASFRRGIQASSDEMLTEAARQLLERGVLVPSLDHSGGGPMQYHVSASFETLDPYSFSRLPLHFPLALNRELDEAIRQNLVKCPTALKEWGRKTT